MPKKQTKTKFKTKKEIIRKAAGAGPKITPRVIEQAIEMRGAGKTRKEVAEKIGCNPKSIERLEKKPGIQELIEKANKRYVKRCLPAAIDIAEEVINNGSRIAKTLQERTQEKVNGKVKYKKDVALTHDLKILKLATEEAARVRQAVGIEQRSPGAVTQTIIQNNTKNTFISPTLQPFLDKFAQDLTAEDVVEAEILPLPREDAI